MTTRAVRGSSVAAPRDTPRLLHVAWLLLLAVVAYGCGPALREPVEFTPTLVRQIQFDDRCELQSYFDSQPPPLRAQSESYVGAVRSGKKSGTVSYQLSGEQAEKFVELLGRLYQRLPEHMRPKELTVTIRFYRKATDRRRQIPIGAITEIGVDRKTTSLPYHPCLNAFFFGREYYKMRRQLVSQSAL
jgi:hypothetical protein